MKTILILGATSTIAEALTYAYAEQKNHLYLAARQATTRLKPLQQDLQIRFPESKVELVDFDAESFNEHQSFYEQLPQKPDTAVCVFGYLGDQKVSETDFDEAKKIIDVNFVGAVSILNIISNDFERRCTGCIIGISSVAGDRGRQSNYFYGSAKAGLTTYLSGLRNRLFHKGIHVMTVKPGFVDTHMTRDMDLPQPLVASAEQVAKDILKAEKKKTPILYTLWFWQWIMLIIRSIPERIFQRLNL